MSDSYTAIAPLVIAKDETDRDIYIYEGFPVPENVTDDSVKRLLDEGFIAKVESTEEVVEIPEGDPSDVWTVKQLQAYAGTLSIDLGKAKNKPDILAVLEATK